MSKSKTLDLANKVMETIKREKINMKPKWYFWLGSLLGVIGLVSALVMSAFFVSFIIFTLRPHYGPGASYRLQLMWASFPWWAAILAIFGLTLSVLMLRKYDFSYRKNFALIIVVFIVSTILAGWLLDQSGLTDILTRRGVMRGMYQQYIQKNGNVGGPGWRRTLK